MQELLDLWSLLNANYDDLCGEQFGRLTAIRPVRRLPSVGVVWHVTVNAGMLSSEWEARYITQGYCQTPSVLRDFDSWIHRRLRSYAWKQWKTDRRRYAELRRLGVGNDPAARTAGSRKGYWHISRSPALNMALSRSFLIEMGLPLLHQPEMTV